MDPLTLMTIMGTAKGGAGAGASGSADSAPQSAEGGLGSYLSSGMFGLLGNVLGGIFAGKEKKAEAKRVEELYQKHRTQRFEDIEKYLKPELPMYNIVKDLSSIDPALKKMIFGRLTDVMGKDSLSKYGIDPSALLSGFGVGGGSAPPVENQPEGTFAGNRIPGDIAERVMSKYGGHIGKRTERATEV